MCSSASLAVAGAQNATYRANADFLADGLSLVYVDLVEFERRELALETLKDGADDLARAAPGRPEVKHGVAILVDLFTT